VRSAFGDLTAAPTASPRPIEVEAIAWSYAAALELGLDPAIVFHDGGYQGRSASLLMTFGLGVYPGIEGLQAAGMTATPQLAERLGIPPYPRMIKWLCD
jgi:hypothetical protein